MKTLRWLLFLFTLLAAGCRAVPGFAPAGTPGAPTPPPTEVIATEPGRGNETPPGPARTAGPGSPEPPGSGWSTYTAAEPGFSFEYPAIYDDPAYAGCAPRPDGGGGFALGWRSGLSVSAADSLGPGEYLDRTRQEKGFIEERRVETTVAGLRAVTTDYRFGGTNRFGTLTAFERDGRMYVFNFTAGGTCDAPERGLTESAAYAHLIQSFQFLDGTIPPAMPGPSAEPPAGGPLYPADADTPAAGICDAWPEEVVPAVLVLDVPSPRCLRVRPDQLVAVTNGTGAPIQFQLGPYEIALQPGETYRFDTPFGSFLAPGVHHIQVKGSGNAPELWLGTE